MELMFRRNIEERVREAIGHARVVLINGPRQAGKTTLVRELMDFGEEANYVTFDDISSLSYEQRDPVVNKNVCERKCKSDPFRRLKIDPLRLGRVTPEGIFLHAYSFCGSIRNLRWKKAFVLSHQSSGWTLG